MHAAIVAANPRARLCAVADVVPAVAAALADEFGVCALAPAAAVADPAIDAVIIATPAPTHVGLIDAAADAGKAVLCEKPIGLDITRVDACLARLADRPVPLAIGFDRRFDGSNRALHDAIRAGEVGDVQQVIITGRGPMPPSRDFIRTSGGLFHDETIHDLDLARWLLGEAPVAVVATASCLVDPTLAALGDADTAMVTLRTARGALCHINTSRGSAYGFDHRIEVFGSQGMLRTDNPRPTTLTRATVAATGGQDPLFAFARFRYADAFARQFDDFVDAIEQARAPAVTAEDGRRALILADAALAASRTGQTVRVDER